MWYRVIGQALVYYPITKLLDYPIVMIQTVSSVSGMG